jgi:hypothetical protein
MRLYRNESYSRLSILNSNTFNIEWYCRSQCTNAPILQHTNAPILQHTNAPILQHTNAPQYYNTLMHHNITTH